MQGLVAFVRTLGATRVAALVAVTVSLATFFGSLIVRVTAPQMSTLFTDLTVEGSDAGDGMTIPPDGGALRLAG